MFITVFTREKPLGRPRARWKVNIKIDVSEIGWEGVDWKDLAWDSDQWVGSLEHGNELSGSIKGMEFLD
jgi:hypothetical protein